MLNKASAQSACAFSSLLDGLKRALEAGDDTFRLLRSVAELARANTFSARAFAVAFDAGGFVVSTQGDDEPKPDEKLAARLARRVFESSCEPLEGERLLSLMTQEERAGFGSPNAALIPFESSGRVIGALWCDRGPDGALSDNDLCTLKTCADIAALALSNAESNRRHRAQEKSLKSILDSLDVNVFVTAVDSDDVLFINKKLRNELSFECKSEDLPCWKMFKNGLNERCLSCPKDELRRDPRQTILWDEFVPLTGKHYKHVDNVIEWLDGQPAHMQCSIDITSEKVNEQYLMEAKQGAELANKAKSNFLSRMSHEIRTPINAIIGMARIAAESKDGDKVKSCLDIIDTSAKSLLSIVNDVLDVSKIEAQNLILVAKPFDFEKMLIRITNDYAEKCEDKRQKLHVHVNVGMPRVFIGDEQRISQVIINLLSNAVKFTPEHGSIRMNVSEVSRVGTLSEIEVSVTDTGIGIKDEYKQHLFAAFGQADGGIARKYGGAGLGLSIAKNIVQMMNGDLVVDSKPGVGSTFAFTIKLKRIEGPPETARRAGEEGKPKLKVILSDSEAESREYFGQIMADFNVDHVETVTLDACVETLARGAKDGAPYDILFLDLSQCSADNIRALRKQYSCAVIAVTSPQQWYENGNEFTAAGVTKRLFRPLFPSQLLDVIHEHIGVPNLKRSHGSGLYMFAGYTILLVEDTMINVEILSRALEDTKVKIVNAQNGKLAVEMFAKSPQSYDLIFMDIHTPEMDGYEATRRIRELPILKAKSIPIIALTANNAPDDAEKSLGCGMNGHLTKPIEIDETLLVLHRFFGLCERVVEENENAAVGGAASKYEDYIDVAKALERVRDNKRIFKTLLASFQRNPYLAQLRHEIEESDWAGASKTARTIVGVASNLHMNKVLQAAVQLESELRTGFFSDELLEELTQSIQQTLDYVDEIVREL